MKVVILLVWISSSSVVVAPPSPRPYCIEFTSRLASAITRVENTRLALNNPGGITYIPYRPHRYPSYTLGYQALEKMLTRRIARGETVMEMVRTWAPDGEWETYVRRVGRWVGKVGKGKVRVDVDVDVRMEVYCE